MDRSPDSALAPPGAPSGPRAGDAELLVAGWYADHGEALYGYLRFHADSADEAEDLTAETFLRAVKAAARFDPARAAARTWLFRIAQNVLRDRARAARVRQHVALNALRDLALDGPSPEERLLQEEQAGRLLAAVAELAPADREIVGLHYGSGLSLAEIGEVLGLRAGTVRTRLWRALRRLRERLA